MIRSASLGATPEGLIQRMEEETRVNAYIVTQKLPKELETQQSAVSSLQKVISQPALGQDDIKALKEKIKAAQVCSMMQNTASFFVLSRWRYQNKVVKNLILNFYFYMVLSVASRPEFWAGLRP